MRTPNPMNTILYPADYSRPKRVDPMWQEEYDLCEYYNIPTALYNFEENEISRDADLIEGNLFYRGHLLNNDEFHETFEVYLFGHISGVSEEDYKRFNDLRLWYPELFNHTFKSMWVNDIERTLSEQEFAYIHQVLFAGKDMFMKTQTQSDRSSARAIRSYQQYLDMLNRLRNFTTNPEAQVFREYVELDSGEARFFYVNGQFFHPYQRIPADIAHTITNRFGKDVWLSVDIAYHHSEKNHNLHVPVLVEIGYGGVSDSKEWTTKDFVETVLQRIAKE